MSTLNILKYIKRHVVTRDYLLLVLGALLWVSGSRNTYFLSDDFVHLADWSLPPLSQIWTWFYTEYAGFYRPLTALWWKCLYLLWGFNSIGYQLCNVLLHTACAFIVRDIARQLFPNNCNTGIWAGLIFLFLPGHIFGILMIAGLTGLFCSLFYLLATAAYLRGKSILSLAAFILALLTKELALSLPLLFALWEAIRLHANAKFTWRSWVLTVYPYLIIGLGYVLWRYLFFGHFPHSPMHENMNAFRLLTNTAIYIAQMATPWGLHDLKPFVRQHPEVLLLATACGYALSLYLLWWKRRHLTSNHLLALAWIGVCLLPVLRLYSPWNTYLPAVGVALLIGNFAETLTLRPRTIICVIFLGLSITYSLLQQQHWNQARLLCYQFVQSVAQKTTESQHTFYIANLPAEWNGAPVLVGDWALEKALHIQNIPYRAVVLSNTIQSQRRETIKINPIGANHFALKLVSPSAFFRIETMEVLSGYVSPHVGYSQKKGDVTISITELNKQGQPNGLRIDMPSTQSLNHVWAWDGTKLVSILP